MSKTSHFPMSKTAETQEQRSWNQGGPKTCLNVCFFGQTVHCGWEKKDGDPEMLFFFSKKAPNMVGFHKSSQVEVQICQNTSLKWGGRIDKYKFWRSILTQYINNSYRSACINPEILIYQLLDSPDFHNKCWLFCFPENVVKKCRKGSPVEDGLRLPLGSITSTWTHDGGLQAPMVFPDGTNFGACCSTLETGCGSWRFGGSFSGGGWCVTRYSGMSGGAQRKIT